jgi:hypothetical protein
VSDDPGGSGDTDVDVDVDRSVPIACTLEIGDIPERFAEWQAFYRSSVTDTEVSPVSVRLRLDPSDATLAAAASLSQREKQCCAFFDFAISLEVEQRWLTVTVPPGAEETLTTFTAMLRSQTEPFS